MDLASEHLETEQGNETVIQRHAEDEEETLGAVGGPGAKVRFDTASTPFPNTFGFDAPDVARLGLGRGLNRVRLFETPAAPGGLQTGLGSEERSDDVRTLGRGKVLGDAMERSQQSWEPVYNGRKGGKVSPVVSSPLYWNHGHQAYVSSGEPHRRAPTDAPSRREWRNTSFGSQTSKPNIRPGTYDGSSTWQDYLAHFEVCAWINSWTDQEKAWYLAACLRGPAQQVLSNVEMRSVDSFDQLSQALAQRFDPTNQGEMFRAELKCRVRKPKESLPELAQEIRRLAARAYPEAARDLRETLMKDAFLDALNDPEMHWKVFQSRPRSLD